MNAVTATPKTPDSLPVNIEVEQALLGAILVNNDVYGQVAAFLKPVHFHEPVHRVIFEVIGQMQKAGSVATPLTVRNFLPADLMIGDWNAGHYLAQLAGAAASVALGVDFARRVRDLAARRELITLGDEIGERARNAAADDTPVRQVADAEQRLFELGTALQRGSHNSTRMIGFYADAIAAGVDDPAARPAPLSTGYAELDEIIGGWRRTNLVILAGRPGMMKTTLAGSTSLSIARRGEVVHFFSQEMSAEELTARSVADLAFTHDNDPDDPPLTYASIMNGDVRDDRQRFKLKHAAGRLRDLPIIIDPQGGLTLPEIALRARKRAEHAAKRGMRVGLVVVDHLGKVRTERRTDNRNLELGEITGGLKELGKELDTCVLVLCQLNRMVESRENKRPMLSDLRESGHIEEDADSVLGLYREAYYLGKHHEDDPEKEVERQAHLARVRNDIEVIVLKNRHGSEGLARLWVHAGAAAVRNRSKYT
jgi:replicative DNA helicase